MGLFAGSQSTLACLLGRANAYPRLIHTERVRHAIRASVMRWFLPGLRINPIR